MTAPGQDRTPRRINGKFLLGMLLTMGLLGGGVHALHAVQLQRGAAGLLRQVTEAERTGELERAVDYLGQYLGIHPGDPQATVRYARLLASDQLASTPAERLHALRAIDRALWIAGDQADLRRQAAGLARELGQFEVARTHLSALLERHPGDGELEYLLGVSEQELRKFPRAAVLFQQAIQHNPTQIDAYVRLAGLLRAQPAVFEALEHASDEADAARTAESWADRLMDAREVKDGLIAANGRSAGAFLERARYRIAFLSDAKGAAADITRASELAPDDPAVILAVCKEARDRRDWDAARGALARGIRLHPKESRMYRALADLESRANRPADAIAGLQKGIKALSDADANARAELKWLLADLLVQGDAQQQASARKIIDELRESAVQPAVLDYLEARLDIAARHWGRAARTLEQARLQLATSPPLASVALRACLLLADCYERIGDLDLRCESYQAAAGLVSPEEPEVEAAVQLGLASVLTQQGRLSEAIDVYHKVLATHRVRSSAELELARALILQSLTLPESRRPWAEAERLLTALESTAPDHPGVVLARAELLLARNQVSQARSLLSAAAKRKPGQVPLWEALASLIARQDGLNAALKLLDEAAQREQASRSFRLARIRLWRDFGGTEASAALARIEQEAQGLSAQENRELVASLAEAYARAGDLKAARRLNDGLVETDPENLSLRRDQFDLAIRAGDLSAAEQATGAIRAAEGEQGVQWRFSLAILRTEQAVALAQTERPRLLREAREMLAAVAARRPNRPNIVLAEARMEDVQGNAEAALRSYLRAIELGNRSIDTFRRAVQLLVQRGLFTQADQVLRKLQDPTQLPPELQRLAANVALETQDERRALELARRAVPAGSKDYRDALWLGMIQWSAARRSGGPGKTADASEARKLAEASLRRAVELAADQPEPWIALVGYLVDSGRADEARRALAEAERRLPKAGADLVLAQGHAILGDIEQAEARFRQAVAAAPDDPAALQALASYYLRQSRFRDAEPLLEALSRNRSQSADLAAWAQRTLAQLLAMKGGRESTERAFELLRVASTAFQPAPGSLQRDESKADVAVSPADLRARAIVLAVQPDRSRRREAIRLLSELDERGTASDQDNFLLAQLLEADGDWPGARARFQVLVERTFGKPQGVPSLAKFVRLLLRHGELAEARLRLEKLPAQSWVTVELSARILKAQGKPAEAASLLARFTERDSSQLGAAAALLEELGQPDAAEPLYRKLLALPGPPERVIPLAAYLARQNRLDEALELCERSRASCAPEAFGNAAIRLLHIGTPTSAQVARVEGWIREMIRNQPKSVSLKFDLANLCFLKKAYNDAEEIYKQLSVDFPNQPAIMNNQAYLLVLGGGDAQRALESINRAIDLSGPRPDFRDTRALVYLAQSRHSDAIVELREAIAIRPSAEMYFHLARAYLDAGQLGQAADAFREAGSLGLDVEHLHPLERRSYDRVSSQVARG